MLSRVADALYWLGRYLERAENTTRLLQVSSELAVEMEGLDETLAQGEWDGLVAAVLGDAPSELDFSREAGLAVPYIRWLLLDESNHASVSHALGRARENARSVREALTREVFTHLNEGHRELERLARKRRRDPVEALREVQETHRSILTTLGAIEHTLSRDQGWSFMKLGEAMERTQRTLLVVAAKLPTLGVAASGADLPLFFARWRGLLRSVASLENYRAVHGGALDPNTVLRFLLFHTEAPRAVLCGVNRIRGYLDRLPGGERVSEADRVLGRLHAQLVYEDDAILAKQDLGDFCWATVDRLWIAHGAIARQYFPA